MKNDAEIIDTLVSEGIIGNRLGRLVSGNPTSELGIVAKAAVLASYEAIINAKKNQYPDHCWRKWRPVRNWQEWFKKMDTGPSPTPQETA